MRFVTFKTNFDSRGCLTVGEFGKEIPFHVKRCYVLHDIKSDRGGHAHRKTRQLIFAASGTASLVLNNGSMEKCFELVSPKNAVLIEPMTWIKLNKMSENTVLVVLASSVYNPAFSIHNFDQFLMELNEGRGSENQDSK